MPATTKKVYLTRHGEAEHNVSVECWVIRDAILTAKGRKQCEELNQLSKNDIQQKAELVVASPLRRTMETMLLSYPEMLKRLETEGKPPILLDILQEVNGVPCDIALYPIEELRNSRDGIFSHLDFSTLSPGYASKEGIFHPDNVAERAKQVRQWLRNREENNIAVVAHGDILRWVVDGPSQQRLSDRQWDNCEVKVFTFASEDDEEAEMVEVSTDGKIEPKDATNGPSY